MWLLPKNEFGWGATTKALRVPYVCVQSLPRCLNTEYCEFKTIHGNAASAERRPRAACRRFLALLSTP